MRGTDHQLSGHPAAVFDLDALRPGPLAHLSGVSVEGFETYDDHLAVESAA